LPGFSESLQFLFDFLTNTFSAKLNSIIREASTVPLGYQYMQFIFTIFITKNLGDIFEV
jgi:hypothetical protein